MSGRWNDLGGGGDSSQDFTQATQEESGLDLDEYTQVEPLAEADTEEGEDSSRAAEPAPWGRLMRLSGGSAVPLMPRPEQTQGRALNEVTLGRGKMCEVIVPDQRISSKHCRIYCETVSGHLGGTEVYVEDMSANGTWINQDMKLVRGQRRLLHSGDEISLLNPYKHRKTGGWGGGCGIEKSGAEPGRDEDDPEKLEKLEAEAATFTFINLNRNRGASHGRTGTLSVAETLRAGTVQGVSSPVLRSSASGVAGIFGGARKVEDFYDVREMIGHGTSGEVRRAINRTTGKQVAVKVIETRKFALTPGLTPKELVQEAEMLKRVDHEYIIKLEDIFQTDQAVYLVMDLVSGGDLFDRIVEKGVYAEDLAQELLFRVLTAVDYLHSQDIVHRDLKPENILLVGRDNDVDVKITDFGLAKRANKEGLKTFCGTPQYFAPEVLKRRNTVLGVGRYGKEADMWSVGVILYILLSGTHPFHTTTLFDQITHASYSMAGEEWEHISDAAKDLVSKLLTESPDARLTADQALAHRFITERAAAVAAGATAAAAVVSASNRGSANGGRGQSGVGAAAATAAREESSSAAAAAGAAAGVSSSSAGDGRDRAGEAGDGDCSEANGGGGGGGGGEAAVSTGGRSSSQDTEVSSTSGAEDASPASRESLSPTEGGGGSAKAVPSSGPSSSPKDQQQSVKDARPSPPPKGLVAELPPPQPREPAGKGAGGGGGGGGAAAPRGRKRAKKENAGDKQKPPPPYSQLQVVRVRGGPEQGGLASGGNSLSQEAGPGAGACESSNGASPGLAPQTGSGSVCSSNVRARSGGAAEEKATARTRGNGNSRLNGRTAGAPSQGTGGQPKAPPAHAGAGGASNGRGKRKAAAADGGAAAPAAPAPGRPATRHSPRRAGRGGAAGAAAPSSLPADDEIMEYSSDDSPVKGKRARVCRGRQQDAPAVSTPAARSKPATAAGRGRAAGAATSASASAAAPAVGKRSAAKPKNGASQPTPSPHQQQEQGVRDGGKQMHLNFGDSGKLNLSKLGPLSRVGAGSAASAGGADNTGQREREGERERERATGDQAAHAAAGGAAATLEDSVGGGAPAGNGGGASSAAVGADAAGKAGKSGGNSKKKPKGGSKPQRTMTHLWKRTGAGQA